MLSNYFQNKFKDNLLEKEFNKIKNEKQTENGGSDFIDGLTICGMLRNLNTSTNLKETYKITALIDYINSSVLALREYKDNFDKNWSPNKRTNFNRSKYDSEKNEIVLDNKLLEIKHPVFENLNLLKEKYPNLGDKINEIVYYTYKINLKLIEYEIFDNARKNSHGRYDLNNVHWNDRINYYKKFKNENEKFSIVKFSLPEIQGKYVYYLNKRYNNDDPAKYFELSRKYQVDLIKKGDYDCVIEFGSGFGRNLFYFSELNTKKYDDITFVGGEFTEQGVRLANIIKTEEYPDKNLNFFQFDYNNSESFFENLKLIKKFKNILCFSFWSIEQVKILNESFFDNLLNICDKIKFVHVEPVGWQVDNNKSLMNESDRPEYNKNLFKILKKFHKSKRIKIENYHINFFNFDHTGSMGTLIEWIKN